jgi:lipid A 4'-phosphatase
VKLYGLPSRSVGWIIIAVLLGFGFVATAVINAAGIDLAWTGAFYREGGPHGGWIYGHDAPWKAIYAYGEIPGILLAVVSLVLAMAARLGKLPRHYLKPALVVVLTVAIGPGLLVNGILKPYWGRPRPQEVKVFGGTQDFRPVQRPSGPGGGKSFTCGHCSVAFSIVSAASFYPCHPALAGVALGAGLVYGIAAGEARMAQGGHFPSDVLWSGIIVFVVAVFFHWVVFRIPEEAKEEESNRKE